MSNIQSWKKIADADTIRIGEVLVLKAPAAPQASSVKKITVKTADTATALAVKFGSTIEEIKVWNYLDNKYTIYGGESLEYLK
jgi:N-acetylmuramoyl-L-alanine amidase